jgi:tetratricopeptide (TPR) repeat protein
MKYLILILIFLWAGNFEAQAQSKLNRRGTEPVLSASSSTATYAVLVGVSKYRDDSLTLNYAHKDAGDFDQYLRSEAGGNVPKQHVRLLTDTIATRPRLDAAFGDLEEQLEGSKGARVILFFSMHGTGTGSGYLLTHDARFDQLQQTSLPLDSLRNFAAKLWARFECDVHIYIDACNSGIVMYDLNHLELAAEVSREWEHVTKIVSSQLNEVSYEGKQWENGVFTYYLLRGLRGLADSDEDSEITAHEIQAYLRENVKMDLTSDFKQSPQRHGLEETVMAKVHKPTLLALKQNKKIIADVRGIDDKGLIDFTVSKSGNIRLINSYRKYKSLLRIFRDEEQSFLKFKFDAALSLMEITRPLIINYEKLLSEPDLAPIKGYLKRELISALLEVSTRELSDFLEGKDSQSYTEVRLDNMLNQIDYVSQVFDKNHKDYQLILNHGLFFKGVKSEYLGDTASAIRAYREIIWRDSTALYAYKELAAMFEVTKSYEGALDVLEKGLKQSPNWVPLIHKRAKALYLLDRPDDALAEWNKAIGILPQDFNGHFGKANLLLSLKKYREAEAAFDQAILLGVDREKAYHAKAGMMLGLKRNSEALEAMDSVIAINKYYRSPFYFKGVLLQELQREDEAIEAFEKAVFFDYNDKSSQRLLGNLRAHKKASALFGIAIEKDPKDVVAYLRIGQTLLDLGWYDRALQVYDQVLNIRKGFYPAIYQRAVCLQYQQLYDESVAGFEKVLLLHPSDYDARRRLRNIRTYQKVIRSFDKGVKVNPKSEERYCQKGIALYNLERYTDAIEAFDVALRLNKRSNQALTFKGLSLLELQSEQLAAPLFDQALAMKKDYHKAYFGKGLLLERQDKNEEAREAFEMAVKLRDDDHESHFHLGQLWNASKHYEKAIAELDKAITLDKYYIDAYLRKGFVLTETEDYKEAIIAFEAVARLDSRHVQAYVQMGFLLEKLRYDDKALAAYEKAIQIAPENPEPYLDKGFVLAKMKRYGGAMELINTGLMMRQDSNYQEVSAFISHIYNSDSLLQIGLYEKALTQLEKAVSTGIQNTEIDSLSAQLRKFVHGQVAFESTSVDHSGKNRQYVNLGKFLLDIDLYEKSLWYFDRAIESDEKYPDAYLQKARALLLLEKYPDALPLLRKAHSLAADNPEEQVSIDQLTRYTEQTAAFSKPPVGKIATATGFLAKGTMLLAIDAYALAINAFDRAIELDRNISEAYFQKGILYEKLGYSEKAMLSFSKVAALNPDNNEAYYHKGLALNAMKNYRLAVAEFDRATSLKNDYYDAYASKGFAHNVIGNHSAALEAFGKAIALRPDNASNYYFQGLSFAGINEHVNALAAFDKAIKLGMSDALVFYDRGKTLLQNNDPEAAIKSFDEAISRDSLFADAHQFQAAAHLMLKDTTTMLNCLDRLLLLKPNDLKMLDNAGKMAVYQKNCLRAIGYFEKYLALKPYEQLKSFSLAMCYYQQKDYLKAEKHFNIVLDGGGGGGDDFRELNRWYRELGIIFSKLPGESGEMESTNLVNRQGLNVESVSRYYLACILAMRNSPKEALGYLEEALDNGYDDFEEIEKEEALISLRKIPMFKKLIADYRTR